MSETDFPPADMTLAEKRVDAMLSLLSRADPDCAALHRRMQEDLSTLDYDAESYYGRWLAELRTSLVANGVLDAAAIERRLAALRRQEMGQ